MESVAICMEEEKNWRFRMRYNNLAGSKYFILR